MKKKRVNYFYDKNLSPALTGLHSISLSWKRMYSSKTKFYHSTQTNLNLRLNVKCSVAIYYSNLMTLFEHYCACEKCFRVIYNFYLVASVYLCHQPEGRKGESELRFRGEAGSGGWTWSGRNTCWWPGQLLYLCIFTSSGHFSEYLLKENLVFFLW